MATAVLVSKYGCIFLPGNFARASSQICRHASSETESRKSHPTISSEPAQMKRGTGGRSSFSGKLVTVFGAGGFLGRAVVNQLGKSGSQVIVPYRGDVSFVQRLKLCGDLGQVLFQPIFLKDEDSLRKAMKYSNVVINLIGRNHETSNYSFEDVHVTGARNIARIARQCGVETLVHVSALNASEKPSPVILKKGSQFLASKWRGEQAVREEFPDAIIFRPSDIFGAGDSFLYYYVSWYRHTFKSISLWNRGKNTTKQPVFVSDVAKGILKAAYDPKCIGQIYQAIGPHRYELGELVDWLHRVTQKTDENTFFRVDLRYDPYFWLKVLYSEWFFPKVRTLSFDRVERDHVSDIVDPNIPTLSDLGVELTQLEDRIFFLLKRYRTHAYVDPLLTTYIRHVDPAPIINK